jgi:hypothetical protein
MEKEKNKKRIALIISIVVFVTAVLIFPMYLASTNYAGNKEALLSFTGYDSNGYIQNQRLTEVFEYGVTSADRTSCGPIATFNALTYLKKEGHYDDEVDLAKIIKYYDQGGAIAYSMLGTNPLAIIGYFKLRGFDVDVTLDKDKFDEKAKETKVSIILYLSKKLRYGHYQMVHKNEGLETLTFYNPSSTRTMDSYVNNRYDDYMALFSIN